MALSSNIFISHDSNDEAIAVELKVFLENIFLNTSVYVSGRDLQGGQTWIENIKLSLKNSQVIISIITKQSINNIWIYFETGAGFVDDKSIPLITDGLEFHDLRPPLSLLQARTLTNKGIIALVNDISNKLGLRTPQMLTGIERLIEESEIFLRIRDQEKKTVIDQKPLALKENPKQAITNIDPIIKKRYDATVSRAISLSKKKILAQKGKLDIPTEEELEGCGLEELQEIFIAFNISYPSWAFINLFFLIIDKFPSKEDAQWRKINIQKSLDDTNSDLDKFEKTI